MLVGSQLLRLGFVPLGAAIFFAGKHGVGSPTTMLQTFLTILSIASLLSLLLSIRSTIEFLKALQN